jgi:lipoyl(octanoyl) transferase
MNLNPFLNIDPCGFSNLEMIQLKDLGISLENKELADKIVSIFLKKIRLYETTRN